MIAPQAPSTDYIGSRSVGVAIVGLQRMAAGACSGQAGHRARLAPTRVPPVLDVALPTTVRCGPARATLTCSNVSQRCIRGTFWGFGE